MMGRQTLLIVGLLVVGPPAIAQPAPLPARPVGALAVLVEVERLRQENARLQALLIGKERELANVKYELGKRLLETQADLDSARLSARATALLPTLRQLFRVEDPARPFDWSQGHFVEPPKENER